MSAISVLAQNWPTCTYLLLATIISFAIASLFTRPAFPKNAPALLPGYPVFGTTRFFTARDTLLHLSDQLYKSGNFSFYFGKLMIVGLRGHEARRTYFESKELNIDDGYAVLFANMPPVDEDVKDEPYSAWFTRNLKRLLEHRNLARGLPHLCTTARAAMDELRARDLKVTNPYEDIYRLIYQLTMRTVGVEDIATDAALTRKTLALFEIFQRTSSPSRIIFPWLPTPSHLLRLFTGARLYMIFAGIVKERKRKGVKREDALQVLLDQNADLVKAITFVMGSLFAGQINSGINAAAMLCYLAQSPQWMAKVKKEVDAAILKHRINMDESPADVLARLELDEWESEFPLVDLCLRETIRLETVGCSFRKNASGADIPIGGSKEVVPKGAFAIYMLDDVHMDPAVYTIPERWDPGRYLPDRAEDKRKPHAYLGWGAGRHPCLGMRFAKLENTIIAAHFFSMFNYQLSDQHGGLRIDPLPPADRSRPAAQKPKLPVYLRYQVR